jgi:hypothetical protein
MHSPGPKGLPLPMPAKALRTRTARVVVAEDIRRMSPDTCPDMTIAVGVLPIAGTLLGVVIGLAGERLVRRMGKVECRIDRNAHAATRHEDGSLTVNSRRIEVTLLNRKELPVTVTDMRVVFYKGAKPLHPTIQHLPEGGGQGSKVLELVNIPAYTGVTRSMNLLPGGEEKRRELEEADRAVLVAKIVGARDITEPLEKTWTD